MDAKQALGAVITLLGILLMLYAIAAGFQQGQIGTKEVKAMQTDAMAMIVGWFMVLLGPALWFGEAPAAVKPESSGGR